MGQISQIPFGTDATTLAGYAIATSRLGNVDLQVQNTGANSLTMMVAQFTSGSPASSYAIIVPWFTVVAGGGLTKSLVVNSQMLGFFGSGNTTAAITPVFRNPGDLRGASIDVVPVGRYGWVFDTSFPQASFLPIWPTLPTDGP